MSEILIARFNDRGGIVEVRATGSPFTVLEQQNFIRVDIADPMQAVLSYADHWYFDVNYSIINSDTVNDIYTARLINPYASTTIDGIDQTKIDAFLNNWNATNILYAQNLVQFDIDIYQSMISPKFWRQVNVAAFNQFVFTQINYTPATGIHEIQADYSTLNINPTSVELLMMAEGANILSHANRVIEFELARTDIRTKLLNDVKSGTRYVINSNRYFVSDAVVTNVENQGGIITTDLTTFESYVQDRTVL